MSKPIPTLAELRRSGIVSSVEIARAIGAYVNAVERKPYQFASGHLLDVAAIVAAAPQVVATFANPMSKEAEQRKMVAVAIMPACPTPP